MNIDPQLKLPLEKSEGPKEMLSVRFENGKAFARINYSSLDVLQTCLRKSYYLFQRQLVSRNESSATLFGSAIHKALEIWYSGERVLRQKATNECAVMQTFMTGGQAPIHHDCLRCQAIWGFLQRSEALKQLPDNDKRSQDNGITILNNYFNHYQTDPFVVLWDEAGPLCERKFEFELLDKPDLHITFFGTIDSIMVNEETKTVVVCDHKTTSSVGDEFLKRVRPNFQYIGYVLAAQQALNIKTDTFMANGIQVAKTVRNLVRQFDKIRPEDFMELREAIEWRVRDYIRCEIDEFFPMSAPNACVMWGSCQYRAICEVPLSMQENVIKAQYEQKEIS